MVWFVMRDLSTFIIIIIIIYLFITGRDRAVGIATRYGLDGPGIESRWGSRFSSPPRPALRPTHPPIQGVPGLY